MKRRNEEYAFNLAMSLTVARVYVNKIVKKLIYIDFYTFFILKYILMCSVSFTCDFYVYHECN